MLRQRGKKGIFWIDIPALESPTGQRIQLSTRTTNRELAREKHAQVMAGQVKVSGSQKTLRETMDEVLEEHWKGKASYSANVLNCDLICRHIPCDTPVDKIDQTMIRELVKALRLEGNTEATINRKRSTLSMVLKYAHKWGYRPDIVHVGHEPENNRRERVVSPEELYQLKVHCMSQPDRYTDGLWSEMSDLIEFLYDTGARLGETLKLEPEHIDLNSRLVTFIWQNTKTSESRTIPMTDRVYKILQGFSGWTLTKDSVERRWKTLKGLMGLQEDSGFVLHALRHTCATRLLQGGMEIYAVSRWLGHKSVTTTERYAHVQTQKFTHGIDILQQQVYVPEVKSGVTPVNELSPSRPKVVTETPEMVTNGVTISDKLGNTDGVAAVFTLEKDVLDQGFKMVRAERLELSRLATPEPKSRPDNS